MTDLPLRQWRRRGLDQAFRALVRLAGVVVVAVLILLFGYLLSAVAPLFRPASLSLVSSQAGLVARGETAYLQVLSNGSSALRVSAGGQLEWLGFVPEFEVLAQLSLDRPVSSVRPLTTSGQLLALQTVDQHLQVWELRPALSGSDASAWQQHHPELFAAVSVSEVWDIRRSDAGYFLAQVDAQFIELQQLSAGQDHRSLARIALPEEMAQVDELHLDPQGQWMFAVEHASGIIAAWLLDSKGQSLASMLSDDLGPIAQTELLVGGLSLVVHTASGDLHRVFPQRRANGWALSSTLQFEHSGQSKGELFAEAGRRVVYFAGAEQLTMWFAQRPRALLEQSWEPPLSLAVSVAPNGTWLLRQTPEAWQRYQLSNAHPELSLRSIWSELWYEAYAQPAQVWQASSHMLGAETKLSLAPLLHGTLKAAVYAMLFAVPLAIGAALYSAYFLAPRLRQLVKPGIEIMEALPTVVLGFIAGLWLAPLLEDVFAAVMLFVMLAAVTLALLASLGPRLLPQRWRFVVYGRELIWLIPLFIVLVVLAAWWGPLLERQWFDSNLLAWVAAAMDISYAQRNAVIVGFAMGFAIIPTIYSLAEDAIYGVPQHLSQGSLALGATPWQTLRGVVLPAAAPGIFSALMVGMGRAVGETMIVLMASGNTPVLDWSLFNGMRSMAANVAMEMPEAAVGSTHFRVLFLAALVLLAMTFLLNTLAEVVRQRMRRRYRLL